MGMEDFHCDSLHLSFGFASEEFDKDAFLKAVEVENENDYIDEDGDLVLALSLPSRQEPPTEHAHLAIFVPKDKKDGRASLDFHPAGPKEIDKTPPYLEESAEWLTQFFKKEITAAQINSAYVFDSGFAPTIPLPFPLVVSDKNLSGLKVKGLSLQFPEDTWIEDAILQNAGAETYLFLTTKSTVVLEDFDLNKTLEELKETVDSLVKEKSNGENP
ncbi:MAG TPA: hypothetical protein VGJ55_20090 [Pyrinomonadaceae bacterium]|jgi:hypothetical protein